MMSPPLPRKPAPRKVDGFTAFLAVLGFLTFLVVLGVIGGIVGRYAWDVVVLHTFRGAPHLSVAKAIGLSVILTYYTRGVTSTTKTTKGRGELIGEVVASVGMFVLTIWVLHFFIPGA